jgi:hypothetical protein
MLLLYHEIDRSKTHSLLIRLPAALLSYCILFFLFDYFLNFALLTMEFFSTMQIGIVFQWTGMTIITGLFVRWYIMRPEKLMIDEMKNFVRVSLTFGNYFRLRDVDTQEQFGTYKMKKLFQEVHGRPFTSDVLATPFDEQVTTFKKVSKEELQNKYKHYPPEFTEELVQLQSNKCTNVSSSFNFELLENSLHPFLVMMEQWSIDPVARILSFEIIFPSEKIVPMDTETHQRHIIEQIYQSLQVLIDLKWFQLYTPFFDTLNIQCKQKEFDHSMREIARPFMTFSISIRDLKLRADKITTGSEIVRFAGIQFL